MGYQDRVGYWLQVRGETVRISLQHKLLGSFIIVVTLVLASVSAGAALLIREYFIAGKQREFTAKAYETARVVEGYYAGRINYVQLAGFINNIDSLLSARVWVVDNSMNLMAASEERELAGNTLHHRGGMRKKGPMGAPASCNMSGGPGMMHHRQGQGMMRGADRQDAAPESSTEQNHVHNLADIQGLELIGQQVQSAGDGAWAKTFYHPYYEENMLVVGVPLKPEGQTLGTVLIHAPLAGFDGFLNRIYWYIAAAGTVVVLITVCIANYLASGIIRPLRSMQAVASAMAGGNYSVQAKAETNDEVGDLSRSLNSLAKALAVFVSNAEKTDKLRRDFVANVSHELRTPLTILRGYNEALLDGTVSSPELAMKYYQIMRDETVRLEKLIAELLDLSQLEARTAELETEPVSLAEIAANIVTLFRQRSVEKGVTLTVDIGRGIPDITGNGNRLAQLVVILLDNALKFTPAGGTVKVSVTADVNEERLIVADTGAGIPAEDLPYIWERFYKTDKAHTRTGGGTGLGLAIAKEIINLHGAASEVSSKVGQGTVFIITFPNKGLLADR